MDLPTHNTQTSEDLKVSRLLWKIWNPSVPWLLRGNIESGRELENDGNIYPWDVSPCELSAVWQPGKTRVRTVSARLWHSSHLSLGETPTELCCYINQSDWRWFVNILTVNGNTELMGVNSSWQKEGEGRDWCGFLYYDSMTAPRQQVINYQDVIWQAADHMNITFCQPAPFKEEYERIIFQCCSHKQQFSKADLHSGFRYFIFILAALDLSYPLHFIANGTNYKVFLHHKVSADEN